MLINYIDKRGDPRCPVFLFSTSFEERARLDKKLL